MGYPSSIATLINPNPNNFLNNPSHSSIETNQNAEITAIETELGIGLKGSLTDLVTRLAVSIKSNGTLQIPFISKTSNYILTNSDCFIAADASLSGFTLTLPTAIGIQGSSFTIKKIDSSSNIITINTTTSQTIDGDTSITIDIQYTSVTFISNGSNWYII